MNKENTFQSTFSAPFPSAITFDVPTVQLKETRDYEKEIAQLQHQIAVLNSIVMQFQIANGTLKQENECLKQECNNYSKMNLYDTQQQLPISQSQIFRNTQSNFTVKNFSLNSTNEVYCNKPNDKYKNEVYYI
jgi:hypothetical protein